MPATMRITYFNGTTPTRTDAASGLNFSWTDSNVSTNSITIPTLARSEFSWYKMLGLEATALASPATTITNRRIQLGSTEVSGTGVFYLTAHPSTYTRATSGNAPPFIAGTNGPATPSGYSHLTTSPVTYDSSDAVTTTGVVNGKYVQLVIGVDGTFTGDGRPDSPFPDIIFTYDEF